MDEKQVREYLDELGKPAWEKGYSVEMITRGLDLAKQLAIQTDEFQIRVLEMFANDLGDSDSHVRKRMLGSTVVACWAGVSNNATLRAFSMGYNLGQEKGRFDIASQYERFKKRVTKKATRGRSVIGWKTKKRIEEAAATLRHKTKEAAAYEISELVGLSPGRVRQLLSKMYPGKNWHASNDS